MALSLLGLGSNLGDPPATLRGALTRLAEHASIEVAATSAFCRTLPVGGPAGQEPFLNAAALVRTSLEPLDLLTALQAIERQLGRRPGPRWGPRPIDLDVLLYDRDQDHVLVDAPSLTVPHPRMAWRRFVLEPAAEVAAEMVHPGIGWTVAALLANIDTPHPYVAITGPAGAGKTRLAEALAERTGARLLRDRLEDRSTETPIAMSAAEDSVRRAELLDATSPDWTPGRLTVSDFWPRPGGTLGRRAWVRPTLLILLDPPTAGQPEQASAVRREAGEPGMGPVLRVTAADPAEQLAEVLAAVDSMARPVG